MVDDSVAMYKEEIVNLKDTIDKLTLASDVLRQEKANMAPKIAFFALKRAKRTPGTHWDPQDHENCFLELPGYESPMVKKKNF